MAIDKTWAHAAGALAISLHLVLAGIALAQQPYEPAWITQIGGSGDDYGISVALDASGNIYISGNTDGSIGGANAGQTDSFLTKLDPSGNELWTQQIGTRYHDYNLGLAVDAMGNAYITGTFYVQPSVGDYDAYLLKFDTAGNEIWSKQIGSPSRGEDGGRDVALDNAGNIYLIGDTDGSLGGAHIGEDDAYLIKFDASGNELWSRQFGTQKSENPKSVTVDTVGNIYISGVTRGNFAAPNAGDHDAFLVKFNDQGQQVWAKQYGTSQVDIGDSVAVDNEGNIFINMWSYFSPDRYLRKLDPSGNELWSRQSRFLGTHLTVDTAGNIYSSGTTTQSLGGPNAGGKDAFLTKYDPSGDELWTQQIGTWADDTGPSVAVDSLGHAYLTGSTEGILGETFEDKTDAYIAKLIPVFGDLNGDGYIGLDDVDIILAAWNQSVIPGSHVADITHDGYIGLDDLDIILTNWNTDVPQENSVPEPAICTLFILSAPPLLKRIRK